MSDEVKRTIEALKSRYRVKTDSELAQIMGIDKSTISSWKTRNKVPSRIKEILESDMVAVQSSPVDWGPFQRRSFGLALLRITRVLNDRFDTADFQKAMKLTNSSGAFFMIMGRAEGDILNAQERGDYSFETATAIVLHDDMADPTSAIERDAVVLRAAGINLV